MKIEQQVCTLEQAKKLKELGLAQNSNFRYCFFRDNSFQLEMMICEDWYSLDDGALHNWSNSKEYFVATFTVAELGIMLPEMKELVDLMPKLMHLIQDNEAETRADMLISLIENNSADINNRVSPKGRL
jgi:quinol monooxygenase YgiN